jgi:hypothetical protein
MTETPQPIHALIADLDAAITRLGEATSLQQRKARNQVVINKGLALHERLQELNRWLGIHWENPNKNEELWLTNKQKYEDGWNALTAAQEYTREYKRTHWEEITSDSRHRPRRGAGHNARPASSGKDRAKSPAPEAYRATALRGIETG